MVLATSLCIAAAEAEDAGMRVGYPQQLQDALDDAILAVTPVQRVEGDVGLQPREQFSRVRADVDTGDTESLALQRLGASFAGTQRNGTFGGEPAHEHRDMFHRFIPVREAAARRIRQFARRVHTSISPASPVFSNGARTPARPPAKIQAPH